MSNFISLKTGVDMTTLYRDSRDSILKTDLRNRDILAICETFDRADFETLLNKEDCWFVRIYFGMDEDLKIHAIIVAADENGDDILPSETELAEVDDTILENGNRCPDLCPSSSPLNS